TSDDPYAAGCTDAINTYFGNLKLPVGVLKKQSVMKNHSRYTRQLTDSFPNRKLDQEQWSDATDLYRKLLSTSPDGSVVIVTIGHLTNLMNLLKSAPDKYSKLDGLRLANKKVRKWLCMGGQFPSGKEANFYRPDPGSTVYCLSKWTKPVVFAGWEVGAKIVTGAEYLRAKLPPSSPVYKAYELYNNFKGRASWDQVAILLLLPVHTRYFELEKNGHCEVAEDGSNNWKDGVAKNHSYVKLRPGADLTAIARLIDDMTIRN
ncbi:MAG: nucleoside hydrolase, partial [Pedobacter sp.]